MKQITLYQMGQWLGGLLICAIIGMVGCWAMNGTSFVDSAKGMSILIAFGFIFLVIKNILPGNVPMILILSVISVAAACPISPIAPTVISWTKCISVNATVPMILAYGGLGIGRDFGLFKKLGWRAAIAGILVIVGTWLWSAILGEFLLHATGYFG